MLSITKFIPKVIKSPKGIREYKLNFSAKSAFNQEGKIMKDKIAIWYERKTPTNGRLIFKKVLPRFVKEEKSLYELIGLYFAEGGLNPHTAFSFSNDEPDVINTFLQGFQKYFLVHPKNWSWSICFNHKLKKRETKEMTEKREIASLNFWLAKTKIRPEITTKIIFRYSNKEAKGKLRTKRKWGSLTLVFGNSILKTIWLNCMQKLTEKIIQERNKSKAASILRGWIAGDGYCRYKVYDKARRELGVACSDKKNLQILYKLFKIVGIQPSLGRKVLGIVKAKYLLKAYNHKLTSLHPQKHLNLLKSLSSYKRIPESVKNLNLEKIREEIIKIEKKLKEREDLFARVKKKRPPKLNEEINWQFLINGFVLEKGGNYEKVKKEIGCSKALLINWARKGVSPSRKYRMKILEKIEKSKREKLIRWGKFFLEGNWKSLLEGLQIFLKASRKEMAKKLIVHENTIESIINQRVRVGKKVAAKIFNLINKLGKDPEEIIKIYKENENKNWSKEIENILVENEWSQRELAEKLGCSRSLVREWLRGLEPTNKYKGKLREISKYPREIKLALKNTINKALKTYTFSELQKVLNVSWNTIKNWKNGSGIQLRHIKRIIGLKFE